MSTGLHHKYCVYNMNKACTYVVDKLAMSFNSSLHDQKRIFFHLKKKGYFFKGKMPDFIEEGRTLMCIFVLNTVG